MRILGFKKDLVGSTVFDLTTLHLGYFEKPEKLPIAGEGSSLICGFDQGFGEKLIVFETLEEMQQLFSDYRRGMALTINWYVGTIRSNVVVITLGPDFGIAGQIINQHAGETPLEVRQAMAAYAMGNPGAAKMLATHGRFFTTPKQVEELVGWPLSDHTQKKAGEIWDKLSKETPVFPQASNGVTCEYCGTKSENDIGNCPSCGNSLAQK